MAAAIGLLAQQPVSTIYCTWSPRSPQREISPAAQIFLRIEKDGDVIRGERGSPRRRTGPNYGLMVFARGQTALELGGDLVQAGCCVAHDEPWLTRARVSSAHHAGLAGIIGGRSDSHSGLCDDTRNGVLLLVERKSLDGAGEVFDGEELVVPVDDGDADAIYIWIQ